jgi:DNA (cytosine-5)-methyltransferase 1
LSITKNPSGHAAEVHRYKVIIVENVVEFATRWELCDWWIAGLLNLCYTVQLISVSSVPWRLGT